MSAENATDTASSPSSPPPSVWNSASAMSAAAPPPTPLNSATICGIAVIFTLRAPTRPTAPPIAIATPIPR